MSSLEYLQNGRYAILKMLGEGGKGIVYKARDTVLNRVVAIKMLKSVIISDEAYSRFIREAQAVAKLNHPNIVTIYDIGRENGKQFFVIEFIDGMDLEKLVATYPEGKCNVQTVLRISLDVCSALRYAHSQDVLHRDIKPGNILINQEEIAKLMDFGLAKILGQPSITQEGIIVGTVAYVAPEIALGKGADARSDLYSFGAVLYEMVTGKPPFPGEDPVKVIFSHIHDYPVSPSKLNPKVPPALAECIMKLLEKEPGKRYQTADDLLRVLREIAEDLFKEAYVPTQKPSAVAPSPFPSAVREVQLIDRAEELDILRGAVDRTTRSEGSVVFLHGEAGIGKTRLTRELGSYARLRGMQVLSGRCPALFRMDGVPPYVLWKEVIKDYLEACTPEQLYRVIGFYPDEVCKLVPELKQKLGAFPPSLPLSPEFERDRLFEAVFQFVTKISKEAPLLVVLDDLQWSDQSSLLLLHYLARGVYKEPLLFLGVYRDTDVDERHHLSPVLTELNRERLLQSVSIKRLSLDDTSEMIKRILEQDDVPRAFCELVYEKTRGNPFFVEEVINSLKEDKIIYREEDKWKIKDVSRIEFPETVKSVIKKRISQLDDECQHILTMTSFVGKDCSFEALCGVTGVEENKLLEIMDRILKTGLIKENVVRGEDVYSFTDIIVRDVVHEEVSHLRHKKLHSAVGCALEKVYAEKIDEHFGELAYHFLEGGDKDKALDYFLKAAEKAQNVYAHNEAISYLQHALGLLKEKEGNLGEESRIMERLGDIKARVGEIDDCMEYWNKSLALWDQLGDRKSVSRIHAKMANVFWRFTGDREKASEHHQKALEILESEPESVELANLYLDISFMLWSYGTIAEKALPWAKKALVLSERLGYTGVLLGCTHMLAGTSWASGELEKASKYYENGLKIALEKNLAEAAIGLYINLSTFYFQIGEWQKAFENAQKASELAKKAGEVEGISGTEFNLALCYWGIGEIWKGISLVKEVLALDKRANNERGIATSLLGLGACYLRLGEWDKSLQYLKEALDTAKKVGETRTTDWANEFLGELFMEMEDYVEAEKYLDESKRICNEEGDTHSKLSRVFPALSKLYLKKEEIEKAKALIEKTYEYATITRNRFFTSYADMLNAMVFREQKNWEQSIQNFEKSIQGHKALNAQKWYVDQYADLLYEYGLMYLARNEEGDKEKAYSLLNQALEIYQKIDAKKKIEKVIAKRKFLTA